MREIKINERVQGIANDVADGFKLLEKLLTKFYKITRMNKDDIAHIGEVLLHYSYNKLYKLEYPFKFSCYPNYTVTKKCNDFYDLGNEILQAIFQERGEDWSWVVEEEKYLRFEHRRLVNKLCSS